MTAAALFGPLTLEPDTARRLERAAVLVLAGGASGERDVSLDSGAQIARALAQADGRGPARVRLVEVERDGRWRVQGEALPAAEALRALAPVDAVLLALHGGAGEDGTLQGFLETAGVRHTGSGVGASALCMDKLATRALARDLGIDVARGTCVLRADAEQASLEEPRAFGESGWFVKPRSGGSSVDTYAVPADGDLAQAVRAVARSGDDVLVEEALVGVECSCGVLERPGRGPLALPLVEIRPKPGRFFDYREKYSSDGARELCPPEGIAPDVQERVAAAALRLFRAVGCRGYARIDFVVEAGGRAVLLEANTLPGLTARSLLPQEAAAVGIDYRSLCLWILAVALARDAEAAP
ncbi:MAG TPA: D-alanine--D-alanine ligase [Planctomycetota bacterium]|nr:D-alanine--D-alanine ligase [Planctomycetota bacterium]